MKLIDIIILFFIFIILCLIIKFDLIKKDKNACTKCKLNNKCNLELKNKT